MRIVITRRIVDDDDDSFYEYVADVDLSDENEAYVAGRTFNKLVNALVRGMRDEFDDRATANRRSEADES